MQGNVDCTTPVDRSGPPRLRRRHSARRLQPRPCHRPHASGPLDAHQIGRVCVDNSLIDLGPADGEGGHRPRAAVGTRSS